MCACAMRTTVLYYFQKVCLARSDSSVIFTGELNRLFLCDIHQYYVAKDWCLDYTLCVHFPINIEVFSGFYFQLYII